MAEIRIATVNCGYNVTGPKIQFLRDLCKRTDVLCIQEHLLAKQDLHRLASIDNEFNVYASSPVDYATHLRSGRNNGGLAILTHKSIKVERIPHDDETRILQINLIHGSSKTKIVNVYLPYEDSRNLTGSRDSYDSYIGKIWSIVETTDTPNVLVCGDFNADPTRRTGFGSKLCVLRDDVGLHISDLDFLPADSFTFMSTAHSTTSWIDHMLTTTTTHNQISQIQICYDIHSDGGHQPIITTLHLGRIPVPVTNPTLEPASAQSYQANWQKATQQQIFDYQNTLNETLRTVFRNRTPPSLTCTNPNCRSIDHIHELTADFGTFMRIVHESAKKHIPSTASNARKPVPGWNELVQPYKTRADDCFWAWKCDGRKRVGTCHDDMVRSRSQFKLALRYAKSEAEIIANGKLAQSLSQKTTKNFFSAVNKKLKTKLPPATRLDDANGPTEIATRWRTTYSELFDAEQTSDIDDVVIDHIDNFSLDEVVSAIDQLKLGKGSADDISAEYWRNASQLAKVHLSLFINGFVQHQFVPSAIADFRISPIVKSSTGDLESSSNYRPIAIASAISKLIEKLILNRIDPLIESTLTENQFGYRPGLGTDLAVFSLQQTVEYYRSHNSPVVLCFLDASKAFDRVPWTKMFELLRQENIPEVYIRFLASWYRSQRAAVQWDSVISENFRTKRGVRQGSLCSPKIFNLIMSVLSKRLNQTRVGCFINGQCLNHFAYADDYVLIAPCVAAINELLGTCEKFAREYDLIFNALKTKAVYCRPTNSGAILEEALQPVTLAGRRVDFVNQHPYLGYVISNDCSDNLAIDHVKKKMHATGNMLINRFKNCDDEVKSALFKTFVNSLLYLLQLWRRTNAETMRQFKVAFHSIYKRLMNKTKYTHNSPVFAVNRVLTFQELRRKIIHKFLNRLSTTSNSIIAIFNRNTVSYFAFTDRILYGQVT